MRVLWFRAVIPAAALATACATAQHQQPAAVSLAPAQTLPIYSGPAPWAYRLGPEVYAPAGQDSAAAAEYIAERAVRLGCDAIVNVRMPVHTRREGSVRETVWGICAYRISP
ncbi:MAG: hypothetical protein ACT4O1_18115 [Gemmatimonadota bacterium]